MNNLKEYINEKLVLNKDNVKKYNRDNDDYDYVLVLAVSDVFDYYHKYYFYNQYTNENAMYHILHKDEFEISLKHFKRKNIDITKKLNAWKIPKQYDEEIKSYIDDEIYTLPTFKKISKNRAEVDKNLEQIKIEELP